MNIIITKNQFSLIKENVNKNNYHKGARTGEHVEFNFLKNLEKAPRSGKRFGQDVEPSGFYVIQKETDFIPNGWVEGKAELNFPLVINVNEDTLVSWKYELSEKCGNRKNKKLTEFLINKGYDGIITVYDDGFWGEVIIFNVNKSIKKE